MTKNGTKSVVIGAAIIVVVAGIVAAVYWSRPPTDLSAYAEYGVGTSATSTTRPVFIPEAVAPAPSQTLKKSAASSAALDAWAAEWGAQKSHVSSNESLAKLAGLIDASGLSGVERLKIARALSEAKDTAAAAVWTRAGLAVAKTEWSAKPAADGSDILERWDAIVKGCRPIWDTRDLNALRLMLEVEKTLPRAGRQDQQPEWDRINYGQALLDNGDFPNVITHVRSIFDDDRAVLTTEQRAKLTMLAANSHFSLRQYAEAAKLLQSPSVATGTTAKEAMQLKARVDDALEAAEATTPLAILQAHANIAPDLLEWAKQWKPAAGARQPTNQSADTALAALIAASNLSANELLRMGRTLVRSGDTAGSAVWFEAGVDQATKDLTAAVAGISDPTAKSDAAGRILLPLLPKLDMAGQVLPGVSAFAAQKKWMDLNRQVPRINPWDQRPEWSRISYMGTLWSRQNYDEALKEADEMIGEIGTPAGAKFTEEQKVEVHFVRALALAGLHRDIESVSDLKIITERTAFNNLPRAWSMLITTLCSANRGSEAEAELQRCVTQGQMDAATTAGWKRMIEQTKAAEKPPSTRESPQL